MASSGRTHRTPRTRRPRLLGTSVAALTAALAAARAAAGLVAGLGADPATAEADAAEPLWTRVGTGMTGGVSGLAPLGTQDWLMVRDNKVEGQNRVAVLRADGQVVPLSWPGTDPSDLEAVSAVPGVPGRYAVVTSAGAGRTVDVADAVVVRGAFTLPSGRNQNEGFALTRIGTTTVAVWGNRGSTTSPGRIFAATFDPATGVFGAVASRPVTVPYPTTAVRHVSDLVVVGGSVIVSSASDPGNDGPFASGLYDVSDVSTSSGRARLSVPVVQELARLSAHKVEGIACNGSQGMLGTDDERSGGWVATAPLGLCG